MVVQYTSALSSETNKETLNRLKYMVLGLIKSADKVEGISNHEIAVELGIPTATVSGLTRPLVISGLVRQLKKRPCKTTGNLVIAWIGVENSGQLSLTL